MRRSAASSGTASSTDAARLPVYAVILAGGSGTRLWPIARAASPKQFLPLLDGRSLFRRTCERAASLAPPGRRLVVAGSAHLKWIREQAPVLAKDQVILEVIGRNTAASIALAALKIRARHGDAIMVVMPADHWIGSTRGFQTTLGRAIAAARSDDALVTIGIRPLRPDPGFGYIRLSRRRSSGGAHRAEGFIEKPPKARARRMLRAGGWLWNSGIFVWRAGRILSEIERFRPDILRPLEGWSTRAGRGSWRVPERVLQRVDNAPIDRVVLERTSRLLVVPAGFRWSDVGTWDAIGQMYDRGDAAGSFGTVLALGAPGCVAVNRGGLTVLVGVRDLAVVRAGDVVLVCRRDAAQEVRSVVGRLVGPLRRYR